ncbi:MAG: DinB family protein [Dehalococcoidia bacterium]|jgi:uncharacterized damage-inducible protein DinB
MARPEELKAFYDGFADQHGKIVETLRPLTPEQMQLRAAPAEWAIWQLASNMVGGRMYWLCFMLGEDDQGIGPEWTGWEDTPEHSRTSAELIEALEKTWAVVEACFDRWTLADLNVEITKDNFWGQPVTISPAWVLQRVMAHEVHHGSEISLILRVHGLPTLMNR